MDNKLVIKNLKSIKNLEFNIPNKKGVYLLTGGNGVGKSTLLVCLSRIGNKLENSNTFKNNFKISNDKILDSFNQAQIIYKVGNSSITFRKELQRWEPSPRKKLYTLFHYKSVLFIKADHTRISSTEKDIKINDLKKVNRDLITSLSKILGRDKFNQLKGVKEGRGKSKLAHILKDKQNFYSEKNFSTGEIALINLLNLILNAPNDSLILIDEIDLSLYSKTQINLLDFLKELSQKNNLTFIISTHSTSMIKYVDKKYIYYLEDTDGKGNINCINPCYHSVSINSIASEYDSKLDYLFIVEDEEAESLLKQLIDRYWQLKYEVLIKPYYRIIPVGGYQNVIKFLNKAKGQLFKDTKTFAFLDEDVKSEAIPNLKRDNSTASQRIINLYEDNKNFIKFLPITPESGIVRKFEEQFFDRLLMELSTRVDLKKEINSIQYKGYSNDRKGDKKRLELLVSLLSSDIGESEFYLKRLLYATYVNDLNEGVIHSLLGPVFN